MWRALGLFLLVAGLWPGADAAAQRRRDPEGVFVNLIYAQQFGLGSYEVGGLEVSVFQLPYTRPVRLTSGDDPWLLNVSFAASYGHIRLDTKLGVEPIVATEDFLLATPGVELVIPIRSWWKLKPYLELGLGRTLQDPFWFYTYAVGVTNLFEWRFGEFRVSVGQAVAWAGDDGFERRTEQEAYATIDTGIEVRRALGFTVRGVRPDVALSFVHYYFTPPATFARLGRSPLEVSNQFEIGVTLGSATPFKLLGLIENPRIGVSYRFGDGLTGIRASFGFPF